MLTQVLLVLAILFAIALLRTRKRLVALSRDLRALEVRVGALTAGGAPEGSLATEPDEARVESPAQREIAGTEPAGPWAQEPEAESEPAEARATVDDTTATPLSAGGAERLEQTIGSRWAIWVGGLAFALGGLFLVRYSIERGMFSPAVRLAMAAVAGFAALAAGEFVRRRDVRLELGEDRFAPVPAILTASGAAILFGVVYAAHGIYGFIGPGTAFALLGLVSLATIALSLLHGSILAGLGLVGSYATPLLVSTQSPNPWALFSYLSLVMVATAFLARLRDTSWMMIAGIAGLGAWLVLDARFSPEPEPYAAFVSVVAIVAALAFIWLRDRESEQGLFDRLHSAVGWPVIAGVGAIVLTGLVMVRFTDIEAAPVRNVLFGMMALPLVLAAWRREGAYAVPGAIILALAVLAQLVLWGIGPVGIIVAEPDRVVAAGGEGVAEGLFIAYASAIGVLFAAFGVAMAWLNGHNRPLSRVWASAAAIIPLAAYASAVGRYADLETDYAYGFTGLLLAAVIAAAGLVVARREEPRNRLTGASALLLAAASVHLGVAIHLLTVPAWTGIALAVVALALVLAASRGIHPVLPWLAVAAGAVVLVRFGIDPAITGAAPLSTTPVFNWILAGYGIPAAVFTASAWLLGRDGTSAPRRVMEALAIVATLAGLAMLARHWIHGGLLELGLPATLGEQTVYTILSLGASLALIRLDDRAPSPVFRLGSMIVGYGGLVFAAFNHFFWFNPLWSGENTGANPVFNMIAVGYLLPALLAGLVWWYARSRRPWHYVAALAVFAGASLFAWISLTVRRFWQGPYISAWKETLPGETYTYSAVWLLIGIGLLVAGMRTRSRTIRAISGAVVVLTVLKVFLVDMAQLEGVLRAVSFMGLGITLIGIGLFYQRVLARAAQ